MFPKFFPKTIQKIIDKNKPTYYDLQGKIINLDNIPTISQPIQYDLQADTTATITTLGNKKLDNLTEKVIPRVIVGLFFAYCTKCKLKRELSKGYISKTKNNKSILKGICVVCGHNCTQFVKG